MSFRGGMDRQVAATVALRASLAPAAGTGAAQNGGWVDKTGFYAAMAVLSYATSGGVTGGQISVKLQDATDAAGTGAADFGSITLVPIGAGPNAGGAQVVGRDIGGARRFIRVVVDSDPTGGAPASTIACPLMLMCGDKSPQL